MRSRIVAFVVVIQSVLFLAHWFLYETLKAFWLRPGQVPNFDLRVALALLSVSFLTASLLAWRSSHLIVRVFYTIAAVWLGLLNFFFYAACSAWLIYGGARLLGFHPNLRGLAVAFFGAALLAALYGMANAAWTRVKRVTVKLPICPMRGAAGSQRWSATSISVTYAVTDSFGGS